MNKITLDMLKRKKKFVDRVSHAISGQERIAITDIKYEVYESIAQKYYDEYIKITYDGGAIAARTVTGSSESCIFQEIAKMINGGYYDEVKRYREISTSSKYKKII